MFFVCFLFPISRFFFFFLFCTILYVFFFLFHMFSFSYFILFCMLSFSYFICFSCSFLYFLIFLFCTLSNIMYITCTIHTTTCGMGFSLTQHYEGKRLHGWGCSERVGVGVRQCRWDNARWDRVPPRDGVMWERGTAFQCMCSWLQIVCCNHYPTNLWLVKNVKTPGQFFEPLYYL